LIFYEINSIIAKYLKINLINTNLKTEAEEMTILNTSASEDVKKTFEPLEIIYQDKYLVGINKPHDLLVHPSDKSNEERPTAMYILKQQLQKWIYVTHRLDSKTSGALLFAVNAKVQKKINSQFEKRLNKKIYYTIVRGYTDSEGTIDYDLTNTKGQTQSAITRYQTVAQTEIDLPLGEHNTSRYSLVKVMPETGRYHQIRKHFAHIDHPIIGDRPHGCNKQNRLFKVHFKSTTMFLHASSLTFMHPRLEEEVTIKANFQTPFVAMVKTLAFKGVDEILAIK